MKTPKESIETVRNFVSQDFVLLDNLSLPGYLVTSDGDVFSCRRTGPKSKRLRTTERWRKMKPIVVLGYQQLTMTNASGERLILKIHRLVLEAFVGPCPDGYECCHNDGNPTNNCLSNLRWDSRKNNCADQVLHGTRICGSRHPRAKLTDNDVLEICRLYLNSTLTVTDIAEKYSVSPTTIGSILKKTNWKTIERDKIEVELRYDDVKTKGSRHGMSKITEENVREIRKLYQAGVSQNQLARDFGVTQTNISCIVSFKTWRHIDNEI